MNTPFKKHLYGSTRRATTYLLAHGGREIEPALPFALTPTLSKRYPFFLRPRQAAAVHSPPAPQPRSTNKKGAEIWTKNSTCVSAIPS